jgi:hypothetical protein
MDWMSWLKIGEVHDQPTIVMAMCTEQKLLPEGGIGCLESLQILYIWDL